MAFMSREAAQGCSPGRKPWVKVGDELALKGRKIGCDTDSDVPVCPAEQRSAQPAPYDQPAESDRYQMIHTYFRMLIEEELPDAQGKMKQFASWFTHGVPGGAALRKAIYESKSAPEILLRVEEFFSPVLELA